MAKTDIERVARAASKVRDAREDLRAAMLRAREAGETFAAIGAAAGMTAQRVHQITSEKDEARHE